MGYPQDHLAPQEQLIIHSRPHWKRLIGADLIFVLGTGAAIVLLVWLNSTSVQGTAKTVWTIIIAVAWLIVTVIWVIVPFIRWLTTHFVITDRRIMFRTGILTREGIDIPMARINSVQFRHGLIDRMFRSGTLVIESASDDPLEFDDIPKVEAVHKLLYDELYDELHDEGQG